MKHFYRLEVIFFSKYSLKDLLQQELVRWLGTRAQSLIGRQQQRAKETYLRTLEQALTIYMS